MRQAQRLPRLGRASGARRRGRRAEGGGAPSMTPSMPTSLPSRILLRAAASLCSASDLSARARRPRACQPARARRRACAGWLLLWRRYGGLRPAHPRSLFRSPPQGCAWMPHRERATAARSRSGSALPHAQARRTPWCQRFVGRSGPRLQARESQNRRRDWRARMGTRECPGSLGAGRPGRHGRRGGRAGTGARGRARARTHAGLQQRVGGHVAAVLALLLQQLALHRAVALVLLVAQLLLPGQAVLLRGLPAQLPARLVLQLHLRAPPRQPAPPQRPRSPGPARAPRAAAGSPARAAMHSAHLTPRGTASGQRHRCALCWTAAAEQPRGDACMCRGGRQTRKDCLQGGAARAP